MRIRGLTDSTNGVFRLDSADGERYAMRVSLGPPIAHTPSEVRSELEWVSAIHESGAVRVPLPVATRSGESFTVSGHRDVPFESICVVFTWLEGPLVAERLSESTLRAFGRVSALLHDQAEHYTPPDWFDAPTFDRVYPYDVPFVVFDDAHRHLLARDRLGVFGEGFQVVEEAIARLKSKEPPRLTHSDLHAWNAKVNRGVVSVFDFEDLLWAWPVQDIATTLYYFWSRDDFDRLRAWFRDGYEEVREWPDTDHLVDTFIIGRSFVMANDVVTQPEWADEVGPIYERAEHRIRDMLRRIG